MLSLLNKIKAFLKLILSKVEAYISSLEAKAASKLKAIEGVVEEDFSKLVRLPTGLAEFHTWAESIIAKSGLPENESMKNALAHAISRIPAEVAEAPKELFVKFLQNAAANEVAKQIRDDFNSLVRRKHEEAKAAAVSAVQPSAPVVTGSASPSTGGSAAATSPTVSGPTGA